MATKEQAIWVPEKGAYQIQFKNGKGDTQVRDTVPMVEHMEAATAIKTLQGYTGQQKNLREAALSLIVEILEFAGDALEAYKGKCDPTKNLPAEMGNSFRSSEEAYFRQFMNKEHDMHAGFVKALPQINERGERLEVGGKLNAERQFQYFLTTMRKANAYANVKGFVLGYWGYCGRSPLASDDMIVPPEVMRVEVAQIRTVETRDNSLKGRLYELRRELIAEGKNPPDDDMPEIVATLRDLLGHAETLEKAAATRRTARPQPGQRVDVKEASDTAIRSAQATLDSVKQPA